MEANQEEEKIVLSYSRLASFLLCPFKSKHDTFKGGEAANVGDAFHRGMCIRVLTDDIQAGIQEIQKCAIEHRFTTDQTTEALEMYKQAAPKFSIPREKLVSVESDDGETEAHGKTFFEVPLPVVVDGKRLYIRGAMDLVAIPKTGKGIEVTDYKTGFSDADPFQGELYALVAFLKYWKTSPVTVRFYYARRGFSSVETYEANDIANILQQVAIVGTAYARETEWEPRFGAGCKNCSFKAACPEFLEKVSKMPSAPEVDPENWEAIQKWKSHLSDLVGAAENFLKDITKKEREYLKKYGKAPVSEDKEAYLAQQTQSYNYPFEPIYNMLKDKNIPVEWFVSISSGSLDSILSRAVLEGKITTKERDEIEEKIEGKKGKDGKWLIEPIRTVSSVIEKIRTRKKTEG